MKMFNHLCLEYSQNIEIATDNQGCALRIVTGWLSTIKSGLPST